MGGVPHMSCGCLKVSFDNRDDLGTCLLLYKMQAKTSSYDRVSVQRTARVGKPHCTKTSSFQFGNVCCCPVGQRESNSYIQSQDVRELPKYVDSER